MMTRDVTWLNRMYFAENENKDDDDEEIITCIEKELQNHAANEVQQESKKETVDDEESEEDADDDEVNTTLKLVTRSGQVSKPVERLIQEEDFGTAAVEFTEAEKKFHSAVACSGEHAEKCELAFVRSGLVGDFGDATELKPVTREEAINDKTPKEASKKW